MLLCFFFEVNDLPPSLVWPAFSQSSSSSPLLFLFCPRRAVEERAMNWSPEDGARGLGVFFSPP